MIVLSLDAYGRLTEGVEPNLDKTDRMAMEDKTRLSHEEVFGDIRKRVNG